MLTIFTDVTLAISKNSAPCRHSMKRNNFWDASGGWTEWPFPNLCRILDDKGDGGGLLRIFARKIICLGS